MAEINVVPYIDVMLVLLIIFMVTAPMLMQGVKVELPVYVDPTVGSVSTAEPSFTTTNTSFPFPDVQFNVALVEPIDVVL